MLELLYTTLFLLAIYFPFVYPQTTLQQMRIFSFVVQFLFWALITFIKDYQKSELYLNSINNIKIEGIDNPYDDFLKYVKDFYIDYIYLVLYVFSLIYYIIESRYDINWNYFRVIEYCIQLVMFVLYFIRFYLFTKIKKFFYNYVKKDYSEYYPIDFSQQSLPTALSITMIIYFIITLIFPEKCCCCKLRGELMGADNKYCFFNDEYNKSRKAHRTIILLLPFNILYIICFIFDIINDVNIRKIYKSSIDNWALNPITSIELSRKKDHVFATAHFKKESQSFYKWKDIYITVKRDSNYNYMKIYPIKSEKGKLCGKDSFGNELYFPNDVECPINDIIIEDINTNPHPGYTEVNLENSLYLYYTNKKTDGNILVDIKAGPNTVLQLNYDKSNEICGYFEGKYTEYSGSILDDEEDEDDWRRNLIAYELNKKECKKYFKFNTIPFYEKIDERNFDSFTDDYDSSYYSSEQKIYLYAFNYQGINSNSLKNRGKVRNYKYNMDNFYILSLIKNILSSFNILYFIFFIVIIVKDLNNEKICFIISLIIIGLSFFNFILLISCFGININYIQNFMNKINKDFEAHKSNYIWTLGLTILEIIFIVYYTGITLYLFMFKENSLFKFNCNDFCSKISCDCCKKRNNNENNNNENNSNEGNSININYNVINYNHNSDVRINNDQEIKNDQEINNTDHHCLICLTKKPEVILSPCGHKCLCDACYQQYRQSGTLINCPYCRVKIESVLMRIISI